MDYSWRPRPIQGNICPVCSISHFPFCPPAPSSRYPFDSNTPTFDPNQGPMNVHRPDYPHSNDQYGDPRYWNRNPSLDREAYGHSQYEMQHQYRGGGGDYGYGNSANTDRYFMLNYEYNGNGIGRDYDDTTDARNKRLRLDRAHMGSYGSESHVNTTQAFSEANERRLKLIRDHGGTMDIQALSGVDRNFGADRGSTPSVFLQGEGYGAYYQKGRPQLGQTANPPLGNVQNAQWGNTYVPDPATGDSNIRRYEQTSYGSHAVPNHKLDSNNYQRIFSDMDSAKDFQGGGAPYFDQRSRQPAESLAFINQPPPPPRPPSSMQRSAHYGHRPPSHLNEAGEQFGVRPLMTEGHQGPIGHQIFPDVSRFGSPGLNNQGGYNNVASQSTASWQVPQGYDVRPPLPASPPPPLPGAPPPGHWSKEAIASFSPPRRHLPLFPVPVDSPAPGQSLYSRDAEGPSRTPPYPHPQLEYKAAQISSGQFAKEGQHFQSGNSFADEPKYLDASHLLKPPHRASRPDHFVIILRGLPGSGKSYLAKMLRDLEVEKGGEAPRIHSMDDYFMTEVEKVDESESSKSLIRGKKPTTKTVLEYCYEPEMEEAYRASMLKSFKKTLDEGVFTFVIVDDRNLRVADFAQFWATAKRSGYEVYLLEAPYKDPVGCSARNVHGFTQEDIEKMAGLWEEAPSLYLQLDVKSLFHGDDSKESNIEEVDMDTEDGDVDGGSSNFDEREAEGVPGSLIKDLVPDGSKDDKIQDNEGDNPPEVKDLRSSKWSGNLDEDVIEDSELMKDKRSALSGLLRTYGREDKSVHWADQGAGAGFSIGAVKKAHATSLVIGPGAGYNLKSNPLLPEEGSLPLAKKSGTAKRRSAFQAQLRAERESFKAIFDSRKRRILAEEE